MVRMSAGTKKFFLVALVVLILFWLITRPAQSAEVEDSSLGELREGEDSIVTFVHNLFSSGSSSYDHRVVVDGDVQIIR